MLSIEKPLPFGVEQGDEFIIFTKDQPTTRSFDVFLIYKFTTNVQKVVYFKIYLDFELQQVMLCRKNIERKVISCLLVQILDLSDCSVFTYKVYAVTKLCLTIYPFTTKTSTPCSGFPNK